MEHLNQEKVVANPCVGPLVRAISPTSVAVWTEWSASCEVLLTAVRSDRSPEAETFSIRSPTVTVGQRHYALSRLTGLEAATWYNYEVSTVGQEAEASKALGTLIQCFRTLELSSARKALRLAYGSCRRMSASEPDALSALGSWLLRSLDEREALWPHLLLLIGDQIYADDTDDALQQAHVPQASGHTPLYPAQAFEDFARLYADSWTSDEGIRQVLACLPTFLIFDDHEITNDWNISPTWQARVLQQGGEQMLVDGLVAYWVYQGWGNMGLDETDEHDLLAIMQQGAQSGEDVLEALRLRIRQMLLAEKALQWDYTLATMPPIFVADVRAGRSAVGEGEKRADVVPRILSQEQMARLRRWMQEREASTVVLVSSVPVLLPPAIGLAEYVLGARPLQNASWGWFRRLGQALAERQQALAERLSFDHWPAFRATWRELIEFLGTRQGHVIILSGDVHFSYALQGRRTLWPWKRRPAAVYQLVASPFRNALSQQEKRFIRGQARIKRGIFGGLSSRMLPLVPRKGAKRVPHGLLFQNVVALVTFWPIPQEEGQYEIQQVYLGVNHQMLEEVAALVVNGEQKST